MPIDQIRQLAEELRKQQKCSEALRQYEILWGENQDICTEWDGWGYAYCLRKVGRVDEALKVCREVYKIKPEFEYNRSLYAWCVYDLEIKKSDEEIKENENSLFKAAKAIIDLTSPGKYTPYVRTIFRVVDYLKGTRQNYPAQPILEWLDKIMPDMLSTECGKGVDEVGKPVEYASDVEKWYSDRCKAMLEMGRFEECIQIGKEALSHLEKFHTDNDVWFQYRIALAKGKMGDKEEAINSLVGILPRKKDWFILMEIAKLQYNLPNLELALKYGVDAALAPGPKELNFRWELFMLLGEILKDQDNKDRAKDHILLAIKLRLEKEWKIPANLTSLIADLQINVDDERSINQIQKNLMDYWKGIVHSNQKQMTGKIKNLVGEGKSGFISGDDGKDYYFKVRSFQRRQREVIAGIRVRYFVQPSTDGRSDSAIDLEII